MLLWEPKPHQLNAMLPTQRYKRNHFVKKCLTLSFVDASMHQYGQIKKKLLI